MKTFHLWEDLHKRRKRMTNSIKTNKHGERRIKSRKSSGPPDTLANYTNTQ